MIDIESLIKKIDILEYISQYADFMQKNHRYWCCSPLNENDTDPSFEVDVDLQRFYDFSTDRYGDVLQFVQYYNNCNTYEAVNILMEYAGVSDDEIKSMEQLDIVIQLRKYKKSIKKTKETNYKIISMEDFSRFEMNDNAFKEWYGEGITKEKIIKYNIKYDRLNNALAIPIYDNNGRIVNISKRTLYEDYRERKIPKYIYAFGWNGGGIDVLWGSAFKNDSIVQKQSIIIVEGIKSVLKLEQFGYDSSVAILTNHLNDLQMRELIKMNVNEYVFALDNNVDIKKDKNIMTLNRYGKVSFLHDYKKRLGDKDAPCDNGKDLFDDLYAKRYVI